MTQNAPAAVLYKLQTVIFDVMDSWTIVHVSSSMNMLHAFLLLSGSVTANNIVENKKDVPVTLKAQVPYFFVFYLVRHASIRSARFSLHHDIQYTIALSTYNSHRYRIMNHYSLRSRSFLSSKALESNVSVITYTFTNVSHSIPKS